MVDYKIRPAIILSNQRNNENHFNYILCPITTKPRHKECEIELAPDYLSNKLVEKSFIRADAIASVEKELVIKEIGKIDPNLFQKIWEKMRKNFE